MSHDVRAQDPAGEGSDRAARSAGPGISLEGSLGFSNFPDESSLYHYVAGGTARFRLFKGLSFVPEFTYMYRSQRDRDFLLLPNLAWDFRRGTRVVPYLIGGAGLLHHRETWDHSEWSASALIFAGGFGAKVFLNQRIFIAPELRIGWEPHIRVTCSIGYVVRR
jgi:hypothetical protein